MVTLQNITKTYLSGKMQVPVLKNIDLSVEEGEYLAIMGPSGSGKSTLMNIIGLLDTPTSGTYTLDGQSMKGLREKELASIRNSKIGFVFQQFNLMPKESALSNVELPLIYAGVRRRERAQRACQALEQVGLADRVSFKPTQLSGGQQQRVAIARAIVNHPKVLLADEPTGALDTRSGFQIMELFEQLHHDGVTIIMITHEPDIARCAQKIVSLRDGCIVDLSEGKGSVSEVEKDLDLEVEEKGGTQDE